MIEGDQIIVFDMEYTAWEGSVQRNWSGPNEHREIVQIGAVKLDVGRGLEEIDSFEIMIRPRINPQLSDYFITLTKITQDRVDWEGVDLVEAMADFSSFAGSSSLLYCNGIDAELLAENSDLYRINCPLNKDRFRNVSSLLSREAQVTNHVVSGELDEVFGIKVDLPAHDAVADARKIAAVLRNLRKKGRV
ncbi:MAG: 3'-5' exonuclease [bacterium]